MIKIPLTVESKKCVFDGKVMIEEININMLNKLLMSDAKDGLLKSYENIDHNDIYVNEFVKKVYCTERKQLLKFAETIKLKKAFVRYDKTKDLDNYGRVSVFKSLGLFSFRKEVRGALAYGIYTDVDVENCHPSLLLQIAESNGLICKYLKRYVNNREKYINLVINAYNCSRNDAKFLFIILLYFGSYSRWAKELNIKGEEIEFITKIKKELKEIGQIIMANNQHLEKLLKDKREKQKSKKTNFVGGVVSYVLQEWECQIIEIVYQYCVENKIINNDAVVCADGIMIKTVKYNDSLLSKFNELVKDKLGFNLTFVKKDLNTEIYDKLK